MVKNSSLGIVAERLDKFGPKLHAHANTSRLHGDILVVKCVQKFKKRSSTVEPFGTKFVTRLRIDILNRHS